MTIFERLHFDTLLVNNWILSVITVTSSLHICFPPQIPSLFPHNFNFFPLEIKLWFHPGEESRVLGSSPGSATDMLWDSGWITLHLCASVSPSIKWGWWYWPSFLKCFQKYGWMQQLSIVVINDRTLRILHPFFKKQAQTHLFCVARTLRPH